MDQSLKARLIGATVLVILAVLLIPELLSGRRSDMSPVQEPPTSDRRTFTIDLGRSGGTMTAPAAPRTQPSQVESQASAIPSPDRVPVTEGDTTSVERAASARRASAGEPAKPASTAEPSAAKSPAASSSPVPPPASQAASTAGAAGSGNYFVQVGAFSSAESARKLVAQLEADGYSARVSPVTRSGKTLHRVRVGPAASRAAAQQLAERLKARGLPVSLVTSD